MFPHPQKPLYLPISHCSSVWLQYSICKLSLLASVGWRWSFITFISRNFLLQKVYVFPVLLTCLYFLLTTWSVHLSPSHLAKWGIYMDGSLSLHHRSDPLCHQHWFILQQLDWVVDLLPTILAPEQGGGHSWGITWALLTGLKYVLKDRMGCFFLSY